jgi:hypothetical protein
MSNMYFLNSIDFLRYCDNSESNKDYDYFKIKINLYYCGSIIHLFLLISIKFGNMKNNQNEIDDLDIL